MKTLKIIMLIGAIVAFEITLNAACQVTSDPDAWENRHNSYQPPEQVMDSIGVKSGMIIAEVGAGRGRYAVHMARRVGDAGKIYANDIDKRALEYLNYRCQRDSIPNVVTILGKVTDPLLPRGELDMVYIINTYHHFEKPVEIMKNIVPSLKPEGNLVIIEHDRQKAPNLSSESTTAKKVLLKQADQAGFKLIKIHTFLSRDNIYIFRTKKQIR
ncbi:MAG: class I SAM-dependent methyltransferase [bacterium]|nr:MAG: class I SAM-dependent methyltransferase [bacterium]